MLKSERAPVITPGGKPVELESWPGITGKIRSVFVKARTVIRSADDPPPDGPGGRCSARSSSSTISGQRPPGPRRPDFKFCTHRHDPQILCGRERHSGCFKVAMAMVPGSPVVLELMRAREPQPQLQARVHPGSRAPPTSCSWRKDDDVIIPRVHAAKLHTLSKSNAPVNLSPTVRSFFVPDPQGFWLEFMDRDVQESEIVELGSTLRIVPGPGAEWLSE